MDRRSKVKSVLVMSLLLIIHSCNNTIENKDEIEKTTKKEFYDNGVLKYKGDYFDNKKEAVHNWFYENGHIEIDAQYKKGKLNGFIHEYYDHDSILKSQSKYLHGVLIDTSFIYYENLNIEEEHIHGESGEIIKKVLYNNKGEIEEIRNFKNVHFMEKPFFNTWIYYNKKGEIDNFNSHYYKILNKNHRYKKNSKYNLELEYYSYNKMKHMLVFGNINEDFSYENSNVQSIYVSPPLINVRIPTDELGEKKIRFIIDDFKMLDDSLIDVKHVFIEYSYEVVD